jgi:hypothetical protein
VVIDHAEDRVEFSPRQTQAGGARWGGAPERGDRRPHLWHLTFSRNRARREGEFRPQRRCQILGLACSGPNPFHALRKKRADKVLNAGVALRDVCVHPPNAVARVV